MSGPKFTDAIASVAWLLLQDAIGMQLRHTPGEYDFPAISDRIARKISNQYKVPYSKVADYLEERYADEGEDRPHEDARARQGMGDATGVDDQPS